MIPIFYEDEEIRFILRYDEDKSGMLDKREVANILNVKVPLKDAYTLQTSGWFPWRGQKISCSME